MTSSQIIFDRNDVSSAYTPCSLASGLDCCSIGRYDALSTHYYSLKSQGYGSYQAELADVEAWNAFGPGVPFGVSPAASSLVFAYDFNLDGMDDVVIGNRIYFSSFPTSATQSAQQAWDTTRHVGKQFTALVPKLMDAIFVAELSKVFTLIVYEDNPSLYTPRPSPAWCPGLFESRSTPRRPHRHVGLLFASTVQLDVQRARIGILLTYSDAVDDIVHNMLRRLAADIAEGHVTAQDRRCRCRRPRSAARPCRRSAPPRACGRPRSCTRRTARRRRRRCPR